MNKRLLESLKKVKDASFLDTGVKSDLNRIYDYISEQIKDKENAHRHRDINEDIED